MQDHQAEIISPKQPVQESPIKAIDELKHGILKETLEVETKRREANFFPIKPIDYLLVFGQGPVLSKETKDRPPPNTQVETEANTWTKTSAKAAAELMLAGLVDKVILTGGKTGGELNPAEADLMEEILVNEYGIDKNRIVKNLAGNTFQNFAYSINQIDEETKKLGKENVTIGLLASNFHLARVRDLAFFFGVPEHIAFSSEQVFKLIAHLRELQLSDHQEIEPEKEQERQQELKHMRELHTLIDQRIDIDSDLSTLVNPNLPSPLYPSKNWATFESHDTDPRMRSWRKFVEYLSLFTNLPSKSFLAKFTKSPTHPEFYAATAKATHFEQRIGEEAKGTKERGEGREKFLTRGFLDPDAASFFLPFISELKNDERLRQALQVLNPDILSKYGLNLESPPDELREKLSKIERKLLEGQFGIEDYPTEIAQQLDKIADTLNRP